MRRYLAAFLGLLVLAPALAFAQGVNHLFEPGGDLTGKWNSQQVAKIQGTTVSGTTGTGSVVLSQSPTLTTPNLGTPSAAVLTNATGLPVLTGIAGLGTSVATALTAAVGSSGAFVVYDGALGTPSSGVLTHATGLPVSTGLTGLGTGAAAALAVNTGSAGAFVVEGGGLGTPSSGVATNLTGTASALNIGGNAATATALSTTGANGTFWGVSGGIQGYYTPAGGGNVNNTGTPTAGQFAEWTSATVIGGETLGGDCTLSTATITCTKTNGTAFGALATTAPGTGVPTALAVNVGTAGAFITNGGALGTPSSGVATNLTGTAAGLSIGGTAANVTATSNSTLTSLPSLASAHGTSIPASGGTALSTGSTASMASGFALNYGLGDINANQLLGSTVPTLATGYLNWTGSAWAFTTPSGSAVTIQTNGTNNASQSTLNIESGNGISVSNPSGGNVQVSATATNRTVPGATDTILSTDVIVHYTDTANTAVTLPQAGTTGFASGFGVTLDNDSAYNVNVTTTTSTIFGGLSTLTIPAGMSCSLWSDGTNYHPVSCGQVLAAQVDALASGATVTPNCLYSNVTVTITANATINTPTGCVPHTGQKIFLDIQSASSYTYTATGYLTGATTGAWPANATGSSKDDHFVLIYDGNLGTPGWTLDGYNLGL